MNSIKRFFSYIATKMKMMGSEMADPRVELQQAVQKAEKLNAEYRSNATMVIAHRNSTQRNLEKQIAQAAASKENAVTARLRLKDAEEGGNQADMDKWHQVLQLNVTEWKSAESMIEDLKSQYEIAKENADNAGKKVQQNSLEMKRLVNQKQKLLSQLDQARMIETTNKLMDQLTRPVSDTAAPTMTEVEEKIAKRLDVAKAKSELNSNSLEGAQMEMRSASFDMEVSRGIDELDAELGLAPSGQKEVKTDKDKTDKAAVEVKSQSESAT